MTWQGSGSNARKNEEHAEKGRTKAKLRVVKLEDIPGLKESLHQLCHLPFSSPLNVYGCTNTKYTPTFVYARTYPQFLVRVNFTNVVPTGCIALSEISRKNLEVCTEASFIFSVLSFDQVSKQKQIEAVNVDIRPRYELTENITVDSLVVAKELLDRLNGHIVTRHELVTFFISGIEIVCDLSFLRYPERIENELESTSLNVDDAHRGIICETTQFYVRKHPTALTATLNFTTINDAAIIKRRVRRDMVNLMTTEEDGYSELVPVKKKLIRPCIALAAAVCEGLGKYKKCDVSIESKAITVPVDVCILDRVLMYLEQEFQIEENFRVSLSEAPGLLNAATLLQCRGLIEICQRVLGSFKERVHTKGIKFTTVQNMNQNGKCVVVIDGMIFDITTWLPHHPGGATIIPKQALGCDAARLFEVYHAGIEPFEYLKQFYIGDIIGDPAPLKPGPPPSASFLEYLREKCAWRVRPDVSTFKSF
eukprot:GSMAST32.ASY1.ANO1.2694.1 assembled CDS